MIQQTTKLVEDSSKQYCKKVGKNLANPNSGSKTYFSPINKLLNTKKAPKVPPLIENDTFVQDFSAKAEIFNEYFVQQCTTIDTGRSVNFDDLPTVPFIKKFDISDEKILTIMRSSIANKAL